MRSKSQWAIEIAMFTVFLTGTAGAATMAIAAPASAATMAYVPAPSQFVAFCERYPAECSGQSLRPVASTQPQLLFAPAAGRRDATQARSDRYDWSAAFATPADQPAVRLSAAPPAGMSHDRVIDRLVKLNREVNRTVRFRTDEMLFGKTDYWSLPVRGQGGQVSGDCEDFALQKRSLLLAEGFDANALSLAVVRTPKGEVHAILLVATEAGEMVLDNLSSSVIPWKRSHYSLIARQVAGDTASWVQPS